METVIEALTAGSMSKDVRQLIRILETWKLSTTHCSLARLASTINFMKRTVVLVECSARRNSHFLSS